MIGVSAGNTSNAFQIPPTRAPIGCTSPSAGLPRGKVTGVGGFDGTLGDAVFSR